MTSEVKVGLLFFIGLGLAIYLTFFVTGVGGSEGEYELRFPKVSQLKDGDPVTYNGVRVGTVRGVDPDLDASGTPLVRVSFSIDEVFRPRVLVGPDTIYRIDLGVLGGAMLGIVSTSGHPITPQAIVGAVGKEVSGIPEAIDSVSAMIEENRPDLKATITAAREAVGRFGEASTEIRDLIKENREQVSAAVANVSRMSDQIARLVEENRDVVKQALANINAMSGQIAEMVGENREDLKLAMGKLPGTIENFGLASKRIEELVAENQVDVRRTMHSLAEFGPRLERIGENLELITTQIAEGKGTIGKLVFSDELHDKGVTAVESVTQRMEELKPVTSGFAELKFFIGVSGGYNTESEGAAGHVYLRIEPRSYKFYQGGVSYRTGPADRDTAVEDSDDLPVTIDLLLGWRWFPIESQQVYGLSLAAGIIESQVGATAEVPLYGQQLRMVGMIRAKDNERDLDDRLYEEGSVMLRATIEYRPVRKYALWLVAGGDDLVDDPAPWVGLRAELLDNDLRNLTQVTALAP